MNAWAEPIAKAKTEAQFGNGLDRLGARIRTYKGTEVAIVGTVKAVSHNAREGAFVKFAPSRKPKESHLHCQLKGGIFLALGSDAASRINPGSRIAIVGKLDYGAATVLIAPRNPLPIATIRIRRSYALRSVGGLYLTDIRCSINGKKAPVKYK